MVDVAWGRILHLDSEGSFRVIADYDGEPNGLASADDDRLVVADYRRGLIALDNVRSGEAVVNIIADGVNGDSFHGLNDLVIDSTGTIYVTDQGDSGIHDPYGRLLMVTPDGHVVELLGGIPSPNGLVIDETSDTIYLAATRDNAIWRVPLRRSDSPATAFVAPYRVGRYIQLSGGVGPDGLAWGPDNTLLVAHLGLGVVWVYDAAGALLMTLHSPRGLATTNLCVDRAGRVYVTESETSTVLTINLSEELTRSKSQTG